MSNNAPSRSTTWNQKFAIGGSAVLSSIAAVSSASTLLQGKGVSSLYYGAMSIAAAAVSKEVYDRSAIDTDAVTALLNKQEAQQAAPAAAEPAPAQAPA